MYDIRQVYQPKDLGEALSLLAEHPDAIVISGGTDVLIKARERKWKDCSLLSIHRLPQLQGVRREKEELVVGPGTCFDQLHETGVIREHAFCLWQAADQVGSPQIRTVATLGGNICNGAVSADSAPPLLVLNARLELTDISQTKRQLDIGAFYTGPGRTALDRKRELLTAVRIPIIRPGCGSYYIKYGKRNALEISTLGCAAYVELDAGKKTFREVRIAFGVAAPVPMRCPAVEALVKGLPVDRHTLRLLGDAVGRELFPRDSWRASRELRMQLIRELSQRAVEGAVKQAGGILNESDPHDSQRNTSGAGCP